MKFNTLMRGVVLAGLMTMGSQVIQAQDKDVAKDAAKVQKDAAKDTAKDQKRAAKDFRKDAKGKKDKDVQGTKSKGKHLAKGHSH